MSSGYVSVLCVTEPSASHCVEKTLAVHDFVI